MSVQAEILALIRELQDAFDLSILLISHDLSVVQQLCDRVAVMYLGEIVERGPTADLFEDPKHPYTEGLLAAIPEPDPHQQFEDGGLSGDVPDPASPPSGCRFHTRCPKVVPPEDLGVSQSVWRSMFAFRVALRDGTFGVESVRKRLVAGDSADPSQSALHEAIRAEYDIPAELPDKDAERSLASAVEAAASGDIETATETMRQSFPSVCVREQPEKHELGDRTAACHLFRSENE